MRCRTVVLCGIAIRSFASAARAADSKAYTAREPARLRRAAWEPDVFAFLEERMRR